MGKFQRMMAVVLSVVMMMSVVSFAFAEGSPVTPPEGGDKNPGWEDPYDTNTQDHTNTTVKTRISGSAVTVEKVESEAGKKDAKIVVFRVARNKDNETVDIKKIGTGKKGVFDSKKGRVTTTVIVKSKAAKVTIASKAFKGSKVSTIKLTGKSYVISKGAFSGTKTKNPTIYIRGSKKTAASISVKSGSFTGLNAKAKIIVSKSAMTKAEFDKLVKKLQKAGFPGKIIRK